MTDAAAKAPKLTFREQALVVLGTVLLGAAFPRVVFYEGRLRGRALVVHTLVHGFIHFGVRFWLKPFLHRQTAVREQLIAELGREPTPQELVERLGHSST